METPAITLILDNIANKLQFVKASGQKTRFINQGRALQAEIKITTLNPDHPEYPRSVTDLSRPPTLYRVGTPPIWPILAIIGSRRASEYGLYMVNRIISQLAEYQVAIASGLAYGIDSAAQAAALSHDLPVVAVLPTSLDQVYPRGNLALAEAIIQAGGSWWSLTPPSTVLAKYHFLLRNQLLAALARAVIVIEGSESSGTLHTANQALELNRTVYIIPADLTRANAAAPLKLWRQGAIPLIEVSDLVEDLGLEPRSSRLDATDSDLIDPVAAALYQLLRSGPLSLAAICQALTSQALTAEAIAVKLLSLENQRRLEFRLGRYYLATVPTSRPLRQGNDP